MATKGTFVLADIGGYSSFLNDVAIEHGREITEDLLNTILRCNRERWQLANVEGDCIFFYREGLEPPVELVDHIRDIYVDFSQRTIDIAGRAACPCGACTRTGDLSLKFIVHAGEFETQKIGNRTELVGPDVVLAHRLLKNSVPLDEYIIVTDAYASDPGAFGLPATAASESFDGVGEVSYQQLDLLPVREELEAANRVFITAEEATLSIEIDIAASPETVWAALSDPAEYVVWERLKESKNLPPPPGSSNMHRCITEDGATLVIVTVAKDEERLRVTDKVFVSRLIKDLYMTTEVTPTAAGSHVTCYATSRLAVPLIAPILDPFFRRSGRRRMEDQFNRLKDYCERRPGK
jgi:hypothetical protein